MSVNTPHIHTIRLSIPSQCLRLWICQHIIRVTILVLHLLIHRIFIEHINRVIQRERHINRLILLSRMIYIIAYELMHRASDECESYRLLVLLWPYVINILSCIVWIQWQRWYQSWNYYVCVCACVCWLNIPCIVRDCNLGLQQPVTCSSRAGVNAL